MHGFRSPPLNLLDPPDMPGPADLPGPPDTVDETQDTASLAHPLDHRATANRGEIASCAVVTDHR